MKIFYIIGMSGSGKTTLYNNLLDILDNEIEPLIQYTTRPKREDEVDGEDYYFISDKEFCRMIDQDEFIEHREYKTYNGIYKYGTSYINLDENKNYIASGSDIIAYENIFKFFGKDTVIPIVLYADDKVILKRTISRYNNREDLKEVCRRFCDDIDRYDHNRIKDLYNIPEENIFDTTNKKATIVTLNVLKLIDKY